MASPYREPADDDAPPVVVYPRRAQRGRVALMFGTGLAIESAIGAMCLGVRETPPWWLQGMTITSLVALVTGYAMLAWSERQRKTEGPE